MVVFLFQGSAKGNGRQQGEDVRLQKGDKKLKHEDANPYGDDDDGGENILQYEDGPQHSHNESVATQHVGEEPHTHNEGAEDEGTEDFDGDDDRIEKEGQIRRCKDMAPVVTICIAVDDDARDRRQGEGDTQVARDIGPLRYQPQDVVSQNIEEDRQQVRSARLVVPFTYLLAGYFIADKDHELIREYPQTRRGMVFTPPQMARKTEE